MAPWAINTHFLLPLLDPHLGTLLALLPCCLGLAVFGVGVFLFGCDCSAVDCTAERVGGVFIRQRASALGAATAYRDHLLPLFLLLFFLLCLPFYFPFPNGISSPLLSPFLHQILSWAILY